MTIDRRALNMIEQAAIRMQDAPTALEQGLANVLWDICEIAEISQMNPEMAMLRLDLRRGFEAEMRDVIVERWLAGD